MGKLQNKCERLHIVWLIYNILLNNVIKPKCNTLKKLTRSRKNKHQNGPGKMLFQYFLKVFSVCDSSILAGGAFHSLAA